MSKLIASQQKKNLKPIPLYTLDGVKNAEVTTHYFSTEDALGLSLLRFIRKPAEDIVLIIHGLTTSSDMFIMPEHYNLVQFLLDNGYTDIWCLDYRMSNRHPYNLRRHQYSMDDIALFDYPPAIELIRKQVGDNTRIHVICHCLGAVSFTMSLFGKAVNGIRSVVANSAALTPRVPAWSRIKLSIAPFLVDSLLNLSYLDPQWEKASGPFMSKVLGSAVSMVHQECDVTACHMLSMMWGSGSPALYSHENLDPITHARGGDLYGPTSMHYYRHVRKMVSAGHAVKLRPHDKALSSLPNNYFEYVREIDVSVLFMTGDKNQVFSNSNIVCFEMLDKMMPGLHKLKVFQGYGHQDVFMGNQVHEDIFPTLLQFLQENSN